MHIMPTLTLNEQTSELTVTALAVIRDVAALIEVLDWPHEYLHGDSVADLAARVIAGRVDNSADADALHDATVFLLFLELGDPYTWGLAMSGREASDALLAVADRLTAPGVQVINPCFHDRAEDLAPRIGVEPTADGFGWFAGSQVPALIFEDLALEMPLCDPLLTTPSGSASSSSEPSPLAPPLPLGSPGGPTGTTPTASQ